MYVKWKIQRIPRLTDSTWDDENLIEITNFYDVSVNTGLGEVKDTFEFKINNFNNNYDNYWQMGDKVLIYRVINTPTIESSDIIMNGIVTDVPQEEANNKNLLRVKGSNYSETLMNALVFFKPAAAIPINEYLDEARNSVALNNDNFKVTWYAGNPTTKIDNVTAFPDVEERWYYKNMLKLLEKYSAKDKTLDGNYYWYVNINNELVWQPKVSSVDYTFDTGSDVYQSLKIKKDLKGVVNFVISKGGDSPSGKPITVRVEDPISKAKHGFKYKLLIDENKAKEILQTDGVAIDGSTSRYPASYPHYAYWAPLVSISNDDAYDASFRVYAKEALKSSALRYIEEHKYGKLGVELTFAPGKSWGIGDNVSVTIPQIGKVNNTMRVNEAIYHTDSEKYVLIEDEGTL